MTEYCLKEKRDVVHRWAGYGNGYVEITLKTNEKQILDYFNDIFNDDYFIKISEDLKKMNKEESH